MKLPFERILTFSARSFPEYCYVLMKAYPKYFKVCFGFCLLVSFMGYASWANSNESLSGPKFSSSFEETVVPEQWLKAPVDSGRNGIVINLDQQTYYALEKGLRQFARKNNINISVNDSTCGNSVGLLLRKKVDIGGLCCPPGRNDRLPGLKFYTLGISPVALIVHPDNPIDDLTLKQARNVFQGNIRYWSELKTKDELPGTHKLIKVIGRLHCKNRPGHWRQLLDNEDLFSESMIEVGNIPDMVSQVAGDTNTIGHVSWWFGKSFYSGKGKVKALKINSYSPENRLALLKSRYPLYKVFNLTTWQSQEKDNPDILKLVEYITKQIESLNENFFILPTKDLRESGWRFMGNELIGVPDDLTRQ